MSDATDAVLDIISAINEYGSSIVLNTITIGAYDPLTGETTNTVINTPIKAIPRAYDSQELQNTDISINDLNFMFYHDGEISYTDKITFSGKTYNLLNIDKKIFQDVTLVYQIQGRA